VLICSRVDRGTRQTDRQTDGRTDTGHHFIMPPIPTEVCGIIMYTVSIPPWVVTPDVVTGVRSEPDFSSYEPSIKLTR